MVQILLMLEVLFTQDSKVEDLFCGASSGSEPSLFFSNYFFSLGFQPIPDDFQHDFARMADEADSSVVLAELVHRHGVTRAEFSLTEPIPLQAVYIDHSRNPRLLYGSPWSYCMARLGHEHMAVNSKSSSGVAVDFF